MNIRKWLKFRWVLAKPRSGGYLEIWRLYSKTLTKDSLGTVFLNGDGHEVRTIAHMVDYNNGNGVWVSNKDPHQTPHEATAKYIKRKNSEISKQKRHLESLVIQSLNKSETGVGLITELLSCGGNSRSRRKHQRFMKRLLCSLDQI